LAKAGETLQTVEDKTILVTGGGGFIGSVVVDLLVNRGAKVRSVVGAPGDKVRAPPAQVTSIRADITDSSAISEFTAGADVVIHLAGPASVAASFESAVEYARVHVGGTTALLDVCRRVKVPRFIYLSSAEVYGRPHTIPVREDFPLQARSPYAAAKISAEHFVEAFAHGFGIQAIVLRPFSVYGLGSPSDSLIGTILRQAKREDSIVLSDLKPTRDYCYVIDLAEAILCACTAQLPEFCIANIGTGIGTSVADVAHLILQILRRSIPVIESPEKKRPGSSEIYNLIADPSQAQAILGWVPKITLQSGLERIIQSME
jgi:nucleoside-diphosphate-sugar epimerase